MAVTPNPNLLTRPLIKKGSKGVDVEFAQRQLKVYMPSDAYLMMQDGDFGADTESVVKIFQKKCGLSADGIVGAETWRRLGPQVNGNLVDQFTGYKKTSIEYVQRSLSAAGRYAGDIDGLWGPGTENGVKAFQKVYGLTADGIWGMQCWSLNWQNFG